MATPTIDPKALSRGLFSDYDPAPFPQVRGIRRSGTLRRLNVDLLSDVIVWAYLDDIFDKDLAARVGTRFKDWGSWDQGEWAFAEGAGVLMPEDSLRCSSAFCIAGQAAHQSGYAMLFPEEVGGSATTCRKVTYEVDENGRRREVLDGPMKSIDSVGQQALGLTGTEADLMFSGGNSIEDIVTYACYFARRRGQALSLPEQVLAFDRQENDSDFSFMFA